MSPNILDDYISYLQNDLHFNINEDILYEFSLIDTNKMVKSYEKNMKAVKMFLSDHGVDIRYIEGQAKKASLIIKKSQKRNIPAKEVTQTIIKKILKPMASKLVKGAKVSVDDTAVNTDAEIFEKILKSLGIFIIVLFVTSVIGSWVASIGLSQAHILFIGACIVAPFVEEYAKRVAILGDYPFIYTGIFAGLEAIMYIVGSVVTEVPIATIIIIRTIAFAFHFATTHIQKLFHDESKIDSNVNSITGYYIAVAIHMLWNALWLV